MGCACLASGKGRAAAALTGGRDEGGEVGDGGLTARAYRSDRRRALKRRCPRRVKACLHSAVATGSKAEGGRIRESGGRLPRRANSSAGDSGEAWGQD